MIKMMTRILLLIAPLLAAPAAAQAGLDARMRDFARLAADGHVDSAAAFFPRRGTWTWVLTTHEEVRGERVGVWRFDAGQAREVIADGPACEMFNAHAEIRPAHEPGRWLRDGGWRRVRGNRFVPRGASAASPTFVQWRREDGRWVVSALGEERWRQPRLPGAPVGAGIRDAVPGPPLTTPLPPDEPHAGEARWYLDNEPVTFDGIRYLRTGVRRTLSPGEVRRVGSAHGVTVYRETGTTGLVDVLYVPVGTGFLFEAYQATGALPCWRG